MNLYEVAPEIQVFLALYARNQHVTDLKRYMEYKNPLETTGIRSRVRELEKQITTIRRSVTRFDVKKDSTPSYTQWYEWWSEYLKLLSTEDEMYIFSICSAIREAAHTEDVQHIAVYSEYLQGFRPEGMWHIT